MKLKGCFSTLLSLLEYFTTYDGKKVKWSDHCGYVSKEKDNILVVDKVRLVNEDENYDSYSFKEAKSLCFILKEDSFILKIIDGTTDNKYYFEGKIDEFYSKVYSNNTKKRIEFLINQSKGEYVY